MWWEPRRRPLSENTKLGTRSMAVSRLAELGRPVLTALAFGGAALLVVQAGLILEIPDTSVVTDPREIFTTTGAGLTGPLGGLLIGILAGIREPGGIATASVIAHVAGGLWMGFAYGKLVFRNLEMPWLLLGWAAIVVTYYYAFVVPGFALGLNFFHSATFAAEYGEGASVLSAYGSIGKGVLPEVIFTTVFTMLILAALPARVRRPAWWSFGPASPGQ